MSDRNRGDAGSETPRYPVIAKANLASNATISSAWSDVAGGNMAQIGALELSLVVPVESKVVISFGGTATGGTGSEGVFGYQIDATTAVPIAYVNLNVAAATRQYVNFRDVVTLTAGTYVIKAMAARLTNNLTISVMANAAQCILTAEAFPVA
jgi:hypothetical protein